LEKTKVNGKAIVDGYGSNANWEYAGKTPFQIRLDLETSQAGPFLVGISLKD
jgi:hypothetical protein